MKTSKKVLARKRRQHRVRAKISGTKSKPRLSVFRSNKHLYLQLIDDESGKTLFSYSDKELKGADKMKPIDIAKNAGKELAAKAVAKGIKNAVFDRGGNLYHGRIKNVSEGAREGGLKI
ncbi:MAG: 50S ribosomal protein L18 [bacterium]